MSNIREVQLLHGQAPLKIGERTLVMGILNITPDSFSDGGRYTQINQAIQHALEMVAEGVDIIDVGGESTRPGAEMVSEEEELTRVIPIIEALKDQVTVPISIDTYKAEVARQALAAGAHIINDIWGAKGDPAMAQVAAESGVPIILMHNRNHQNYDNLIGDMIKDLQESINLVLQAGVKQEKIILDPGIGFAKDLDDNLAVMRNLNVFTSLGYPVLLGTSRKSMIGRVLDLPVSERVEGTLATVVLGVQQGVDIVRVHNVKETVRVVKMTDAIVRGGSLHG